ncbi:hypothetical protein, partial [Aquisphaera insulae]|uniref:hypothetical protein n=1 Tax=Aquisphaera insulae TaxID=2712864 RepID=UPI00196A8928
MSALASALTVDTIDYNNGVVLVPGSYQLAKPGAAVDLRAQVTDAASGTYTYSWNTSGLSDATSITGTATANLKFSWNTTFSTTRTDSVTLTVTDPNNVQVTKTYTFQAFAGTGSSTSGTTWGTTLDPG